MKGIILAAGKGTRLFPITKSVTKALLPIYDKPLIYYPLSVLMAARIRDILIISTPEAKESFIELMGDGSQLGINLSFEVQQDPKGPAEALTIGADFVGSDSVCLIFGDNFFYGQNFNEALLKAADMKGATVFGYQVKDPTAFGVVEFDENHKVVSLEEKPKNPKSDYAVPGLYFYDNRAIDIARNLKPSARGELEITDVNKAYLQMGELNVILLGKGLAWLDTGSPDGMISTSIYVETVQNREGVYIACIEEIAYRNGWISKSQLKALGEACEKTAYGQHLIEVAEEEV